MIHHESSALDKKIKVRGYNDPYRAEIIMQWHLLGFYTLSAYGMDSFYPFLQSKNNLGLLGIYQLRI